MPLVRHGLNIMVRVFCLLLPPFAFRSSKLALTISSLSNGSCSCTVHSILDAIRLRPFCRQWTCFSSKANLDKNSKIFIFCSKFASPWNDRLALVTWTENNSYENFISYPLGEFGNCCRDVWNINGEFLANVELIDIKCGYDCCSQTEVVYCS